MLEDEIKKEADTVVQEFKRESKKIYEERKKAIDQIRKTLEEEKIKEIKHRF